LVKVKEKEREKRKNEHFPEEIGPPIGVLNPK
jgi:hypothetical protein